MSDNEDYDDQLNEQGDQVEEVKTPTTGIKASGKVTFGKKNKQNAKNLKNAKAAKAAAANPNKAVIAAAKAVSSISLASITGQEEKADVFSYRSSTGVLMSDPLARDVKIGGFTLNAYSQELIKDSALEFTIGRRYGLIGSNGSGKTTFLKCIANREVPIPKNIDIFLLDNEAPPTDMTGVQWIVSEVVAEIARLEALAEELCDTLGPESGEVQNVYEAIEKLESMNPTVHASVLLHGLGFGPKMMAKATKDMSGGWRMRVALAKALFVRPTLLLLDEPTNHLDLEACVWLENYLSTYDKCLIVVSHSQDFLNGVCTHIMEFTPKNTLQYWTGNYDMYVRTKAEVEANQLKRYEKEQDEIRHIKEFIASCGTYANLVKQAKSRQKVLDKMIADGLTEKPAEPPKFNFKFAPCERLAPPVLQFQDVSFSYSGKKEDYLYEHVDLAVDNDSRVALVGPNGAGKSTLLKLMVDELKPTEGEIRRHMHMKIGRYHQHVMEELVESMTPLEFVMNKFADRRMDEEAWRGVIGRYGVSGKLQKTKIGTMSDGQKSRLVFCMLAIQNPNILLLDEPTNHLDMQCIDALAAAINSFEGGVVLVSHDFRLISQVAKEIWVCDKNQVSRFKGDIRQYKAELLAEVKAKEAAMTQSK